MVQLWRIGRIDTLAVSLCVQDKRDIELACNVVLSHAACLHCLNPVVATAYNVVAYTQAEVVKERNVWLVLLALGNHRRHGETTLRIGCNETALQVLLGTDKKPAVLG